MCFNYASVLPQKKVLKLAVGSQGRFLLLAKGLMASTSECFSADVDPQVTPLWFRCLYDDSQMSAFVIDQNP